MLDRIEKLLSQHYPHNEGFFVFGSHVYGTSQKDSDVDVVVIENSLSGQSKNHGEFDLQFVSKKEFMDQLRSCHIRALEGFYTDQKRLKFKVSQDDIDFKSLRASISQKSSHSWVKAKKKLIDGEFYIGKKSLWHSLRIMLFGIQLAEAKTISNFKEANDLYLPILTGSTNWEELLGAYKEQYNALHSRFKALQPKE